MVAPLRNEGRLELPPPADAPAEKPAPAAPPPTTTPDQPREPRPAAPRAPVPAPMDGAFTGRLPAAPPAERPGAGTWTGPVLDARSLDEASEARLLGEAHADCLLLPYGSFDARRPPVVLVHGIDGAGEDLRAVADRLAGEGHQVFFALYRDRDRLTHESGDALARALVDLRREHYAAGTPLDIVAHSMGGIVARAALNTLADPAWLGESNTNAATPRAGFGDVRLRTLDTPWDGFAHEPRALSFLAPIIEFFMGLFGWRGAAEMRGSSALFERLYTPQLAGVSIQNAAAREEGEADSIRALPDLSARERAAVARALLGGPTPRDPRARNAAGSLTQDDRAAALRERLRAEVSTGASEAELAAALSRAYEAVMPRFAGDHVTVLRNHAGGGDAVDWISRELGGGPRAPAPRR